MSNSVLLIQNAGYGTTPPCPEAKFAPGNIVKVRRLKHLAHLPNVAAIAVVVPPGFHAEYALADATGRPRPLMVTRTKRCVSYLVAFDGNPTPHLLREAWLLPTGEADVPVKWNE